jgi:ubiquinone/menaquinone biosynthesis C-methylase UbiE
MIQRLINNLSKNVNIFIFLRRIIELDSYALKKVIDTETKNLNDMSRILDLGCGTGDFSPCFYNFHYTGIDVEPEYIQYAKNKYNLDFRLMDGRRLRFGEETFDCITIIGVLHHLCEKSCLEIFHELKRVIKPGGLIIIIEDVEIGSRWDILGNIIRKLDVGNYIRTEEQWYKLISSNFNILKNYRIRSFIPSYAVFVLSA